MLSLSSGVSKAGTRSKLVTKMMDIQYLNIIYDDSNRSVSQLVMQSFDRNIKAVYTPVSGGHPVGISSSSCSSRAQVQHETNDDDQFDVRTPVRSRNT
jgi:hypothetical protein